MKIVNQLWYIPKYSTSKDKPWRKGCLQHLRMTIGKLQVALAIDWNLALECKA
jgi:hypothetical protein